ncbi:hypothetical protein LCGC14_2306480 [marine sediment metagenome]|uniref:Uncharacterized protein n=1 Tax=marine sediment metagenome TaxID=412755 RepID=A0A0F9D9E6_9ZZZZ
MSKVTIIIEDSPLSVEDLEAMAKRIFARVWNDKNGKVYIVPLDED